MDHQSSTGAPQGPVMLLSSCLQRRGERGASLQDDIITFTDCHFLSIQTVTDQPEVSGAPALTASEVHDTGRPKNRMKCGTLSGGEAQ
ncbi:unnamed protein product [Boreogadus saida]